SLKFVNLDLETLVHDFGLNKKVELSGKLTGRLNFQGAGLNLHALNGDFSSAEYGGRLIIKDTQFLENLARNSKQPLDIFVESFQDYEYNTGIIRLALDKGNLILDIALDGEAGKRNLNITLHDFRLKQEGL
ncbi:MAG: YdbH domain-containing protein, partial [Candidatus Omnitrophota bacterium]